MIRRACRMSCSSVCPTSEPISANVNVVSTNVGRSVSLPSDFGRTALLPPGAGERPAAKCHADA